MVALKSSDHNGVTQPSPKLSSKQLNNKRNSLYNANILPAIGGNKDKEGAPLHALASNANDGTVNSTSDKKVEKMPRIMSSSKGGRARPAPTSHAVHLPRITSAQRGTPKNRVISGEYLDVFKEFEMF